MLMRIFGGLLIASGLSACQPAPMPERPVLDALAQPVDGLARGVVARDWAVTTARTRDIVAILDAAKVD